MNKTVLQGKDAMEAISRGVDMIVNPVKSTIGPRGRTVILSRSAVADYGIVNAPVEVTKDGYKITQNISSSDANEQVGCMLVKEAADRQMRDVGDGTSSCSLLVQAILTKGLELIAAGGNHVEITSGINSAVDYVVEELKKLSTPIDGDVERIRQVATISANGDAEIGGLIAQAFSQIGKDGIINLEESKGRETTIKISDGIKFGRGWISPYFITNRAKAECELDNPFILIYDRPITQIAQLMPVLEQVLLTKRPLMIFCDNSEGDALATLTFNAQQNRMQACVVAMDFLGQRKRDFMEDIAAATNGTYINELKGTKLENVKLDMLGQAKKVVIGKEDTVIIGGFKDEQVFNNLVDSLKEQEEKEEEGEEKDLLRRRIARLKGSVAILSVGATTEIQMKEKSDRVDDAIKAARSAVEEGFVAGGGTAFLRIRQKKSVNAGWNLIMDILEAPLSQICTNVGADAEGIVAKVYQAEGDVGYNAKTGVVEDLVKAGVIEPTKSNRCALQNAASVCCQILSSDFMITDTL